MQDVCPGWMQPRQRLGTTEDGRHGTAGRLTFPQAIGGNPDAFLLSVFPRCKFPL